MRPTGTPIDEKTVAKLARYGIWTDRNRWQMSKEEAVVLMGEVMFERFVQEFKGLWRELFPNPQASEIGVSAEYVQTYVREEWKPSSEYERAARLRNEYLQDRVMDPSQWYQWKGGDKYGVGGTYRLG
jgi:hypothetical protein